MSGDTTYRVVLDLSTQGNLGARVGELGEKMDRAHGGAGKLQHALTMTGEVAERSFHRVGELVEGLADKMIHVAEAGALALGGGILAGAAYGVTHLNRELEETQISLGAIFQAQGFTRDFNSGFEMASDQVAKMKQDVKTLPGDLGQLSNMMKMISTPAAQGGLGADDIRQLAGKTMLTSTILGVQQDMAAREMANLLAGRAGAHNILGGRLGLIGDKAKEFNAEGPQKRVAEIQELLSRYQGASDRFAQSFVANWTTLKDNIKYGFLADATSPLFDSVKKTMATINTWFDNNQDRVKSWASAFGQRLAMSWEGLVGGAAKFGPAMDNLGHRFFELWDAAINKAHELEPILSKVASFVERLNVQDLGRGAKDLLELKLAGMALQGTGSAIGMGLTGMRLAQVWGMGAGGTAAAGGVASEAGASGMAAIGALAIEALPALVVGAIGAAGAIDILTDKTSKYHTEATALAKDIAENATDVWHQLGDAAQPALSSLRQFGDYLGLGMLQDIEAGVNAVHFFGDSMKWIRDMLSHPGESADDQLARAKFAASRDDAGPIADHLGMVISGAMAGSLSGGKGTTGEKKLPGGGGGTNIQKVEIVVRGSDDPSRVARLVVSQLEKVARNPTRSPGVPDWAR